jgi:hypothetical protein
MKAIGIHKEYYSNTESDIIEIISTISGLRVVVSTMRDSVKELLVEYFFEYDNGFRYLDEGDLIAYWESSQFKTGHHLYEVEDGGWISGESLQPGILSISSEIGMREWFIKTTNGCLTVLSNFEPIVREVEN